MSVTEGVSIGTRFGTALRKETSMRTFLFGASDEMEGGLSLATQTFAFFCLPSTSFPELLYFPLGSIKSDDRKIESRMEKYKEVNKVSA